MNIQTLKLELVKKILDINSPEILNSIHSALTQGDKDFWLDLTDDQKKEIAIGRRQVEKGETIDWDSLRERIS
jgi:hypothetical protein